MPMPIGRCDAGQRPSGAGEMTGSAIEYLSFELQVAPLPHHSADRKWVPWRSQASDQSKDPQLR